MDCLNRYRSAIEETLSRFVEIQGHDKLDESVQTYRAFDRQTDQYLVIRTGWLGQRRIKGIVLHIRIDEGKVWIEENSTDCEIANELEERGVATADIIFGFHHPSLRESATAVVA